MCRGRWKIHNVRPGRRVESSGLYKEEWKRGRRAVRILTVSALHPPTILVPVRRNPLLLFLFLSS